MTLEERVALLEACVVELTKKALAPVTINWTSPTSDIPPGWGLCSISEQEAMAEPGAYIRRRRRAEES